jgi:hypothetical protein
VFTRQNPIIANNGCESLALIPFLDLCNHEDGEQCTYYDQDMKNAKIYAMKSYSIGDEIKISYGKKSAFNRLFYNGFISNDLSNDYAYLNFGIGQMNEKKRLLLNKFGFKMYFYLYSLFFRFICLFFKSRKL